MNPLLDCLTSPQRQAVTHRDGPLLILAGPGSGKTRVITHRIAQLLADGVPAAQILALTFTNKAADEMKARVEHLAPGQRVWLSTFHRFGARLLRANAEYVGLTPNFTIYDTSDAKQTLKRVIEAHRIKTMNYSPERIAAAISGAKNRLISPDEYQARAGSPLSQVVAEVYPAYQQRLLASSAVDFDDLLMHVASLLHQNPEVRAAIDDRYRYIMVDEYQDTNRAQYVILRAMAHDYPNLAVTGDPDQSIYGWRGADLNNILEFEKDFPDVEVVRLERNYRSTKRILRIADALIRHNVRRKPKELFTENDEGPPVRLAAFVDQDAEAAGIASHIAASIDRGRRASDFAIFYRVNALSRALEKGLREAGVPYQMVRGQEFYQRKEIKDVLAYCQLVNNPRDDIAFERTVNTPPRGIGRKTLDRLTEFAYRRGISLLEAASQAEHIESLTKRPVSALHRFAKIIDHISAVAMGDVEEVIGRVLDESGYTEYLEGSDAEEDLNRLANIQELLTDARQFDERNPGGGGLEEYLEYTWLVNETDAWDNETDKVTLMTLHAAKGLEFPVVFLVAVEDGVLPHERVRSNPDQLEEERRLAFVGLTRAKQELQLSYAVQRDFRGQRRFTVPSSFLFEVPRHELEVIAAPPREFAGEEDDWLDEHIDDVVQASPVDLELADYRVDTDGDAGLSVAAAAIVTADKWAAKEKSTTKSKQPSAPARCSPDAFGQGMTVLHPEFGPGKIVALSGSGKNRRATVRFATAGEKKFVLAHSPLRPAGK